MDSEAINNEIKKWALQNALRHAGKAEQRAVVSKLLGDHPELRPNAAEISRATDRIIAETNALTPDEQRKMFIHIAPELQQYGAKPQADEIRLPNLPHHEHVIMRFAPNPNGPATLGSARGIVVNSEYARQYSGSFILRFDDTDPQTKRPMLEAYWWYLDDCDWLGATPDSVVIASDRIETYYRYAERLLEKGGAYVCTCSQERFKQYKQKRAWCPDRSNAPKKNLQLWRQMLDGHFGEKEAVLRIKTDMAHKNPALRDWIAFRIIDAQHPRGLSFRVWPMLDFESAIEDHELGVTHIVRGKDLRDSEKRQIFVYDDLGWKYPYTFHWGRISVHEFGKFSTSALGKQICSGFYRGWDDPRLPTLRALRRRGFAPEAIRRFFLRLGINESDISVSLENLYAENRKLVDPIANRYFFVQDPVNMNIIKAEPTRARVPLHPSSALFREIPVKGDLCISSKDLTFATGDLVRLKDLYNVRILAKDPLNVEYAGKEIVKGTKIIHWAPPEGPLVEVLTPTRVDIGVGEAGIETELGNVVQFERYGFVRVDAVERNGRAKITCYFTHK